MKRALLVLSLLCLGGAAAVDEDRSSMIQVQSDARRFSVHRLFSTTKKLSNAFSKIFLVGQFVLKKEQVLNRIKEAGANLERKTKKIADKLVEETEPNMPIEKFGGLIRGAMDDFKKVYTAYETGLLIACKPLGEMIDKSKTVMPEIIDQFKVSLLQSMNWEGLKEVSIEHGLEEVKGYFENIDSLPRAEQERMVRKMNAAQADGLEHGQKEVNNMDEYSMLSQTLLIMKESEKANAESAFRFMSAMTKQGQAGFKLLVEGVHDATAKLGIEWGFGDDYLPKKM